MSQEFKDESVHQTTEEMPGSNEYVGTLSVEYLTGLWDLSREQVLEKILKDKLPYRVIDDQIRVSSDAVPVGGK